MAVLTHYVKLDATGRTTTSATQVEEANYTVSWANLTGAGLANNDDVVIIVAVKTIGSTANVNVTFQVGVGTTYAGRTSIADSLSRAEPSTTSDYSTQYIWFDRRTLVTNENIYFSVAVTTGTGYFIEQRVIVIKLADLNANDWGYADQTHSGNAPSAYDTSGASFSTGAAGDWLIFCCTHWLIDSTTADLLVAISAGGSDYSEIHLEGEDVDDQYCTGTIAYRAGLGSGQTVRARYRTDDGASHDCDRTAVFGLRLDAFEDHWGAHTTNTVTHSVVDTFQEFAGNGSYGLTTTGPFAVIGWPIHTTNETTKQPYGRIQIANADWGGATDSTVSDNIAAGTIAPLLFGYVASQASGTLDIDLDCAAFVDVTPNFSCTEQVAAAFSLTLASGGTQYPQTVSATSAGTASISKAAGKIIAATSAGAASVRKAVGKVIAAAGAGSASIRKTAGKIVSATSAGTASVRKATGKIVSATSAGTASVVTALAFVRVIAAAGAGTVSLSKAIAKSVAASGAGSVSFAKAVAKIVAAAGSGSVSSARAVAKIIGVSGIGSVTITTLKSVLLTIAATATATVGILKAAGIALAVPASSGVMITRSLLRLINAAGTGAAAFAKDISKAVSATATGAVSISQLKVLLRTISIGASGAVTVVALARRLVAIPISGAGAVAIAKATAKSVAVVSTATVDALKGVAKLVSASAAGGVAVSASRAFFRAITVAASSAVVILKIIGRGVDATAVGTVSVVKSVEKIVTVTSASLVAILRGFAVLITAAANALVEVLTDFIPAWITPPPGRWFRAMASSIFRKSGKATPSAPGSVWRAPPDE